MLQELEVRKATSRQRTTPWDKPNGVYVNAKTGYEYRPHSDVEREALLDDNTPYIVSLGGEGSGKTTWLVIKVLERLRRGCTGIMGSPDLPHFRTSLWTEFQQWCPWHHVVPSQRYRASPDWEPQHKFTLNFLNNTELMCGGFKEPIAWEGGNVNFGAYDEVRRASTPQMVKVLAGRARIEGPGGVPPQVMFSSTPRGGSPGEHWMYDWFGPAQQDDPLAAFKAQTRAFNLSTRDNLKQLSQRYTDTRSSMLSDAEAQVYVEGGWGSTDEDTPFLDDIVWWDKLRDDETVLSYSTQQPHVLAVDAATDNDSFAFTLVGREPAGLRRVLAVGCREWKPPKNGKIDFNEPYEAICDLAKDTNIAVVTYDPYQLHMFMAKLRGVVDAHFKQFDQTSLRLKADKTLRDAILSRLVAHAGNETLRSHLMHANKQVDPTERERLRIVKRSKALKVDAAVCLSMGNWMAQEYL